MSIFTFEILLSGIIIGVIIFQSFFVAPIIFSSIEESQARIFIRKIFPKLFIFLTLLGFIMIVSNLLLRKPNNLEYLSLINFLLPLICYLIIPATNNATDNKDERKFKILHTVSVLLTLVILLSNLILSFFKN